MTNHGYKYVFFRICINFFWSASAAKSFDFVVWHVFFHDFDQWFACQQVILILFLGAECVWSSQRHLRLHEQFVYQERHFERIERYMSFETFSKHIFRNMFLNKQHFLEQTATHFWTHRAVNNWNTKCSRPHVLTLIMLGLPNGCMLDHDKTLQLRIFWAKLASRIPSDEARQIRHVWDTVIWNSWLYSFLAVLVFWTTNLWNATVWHMGARCLHGLVSADFFVMMERNKLDLGNYTDYVLVWASARFECNSSRAWNTARIIWQCRALQISHDTAKSWIKTRLPAPTCWKQWSGNSRNGPE